MSEEKYISELAKVVAGINEPKLAHEFLQNILTPKELDEIARRLQIVKMLHEGVPQREIAEKLHVSIGTVSRGSRELQYGAGGFKAILSLWKNS